MSLEMRWLGTACFEIKLPGGKRVITDPFVDEAVSSPISSDQFQACDYIFLTHGHWDHVLDVGKLARRFRPRIFCSAVVKEALVKIQGVDASLIQPIISGEVLSLEGLTVEVLPGLHLDFQAEYRRLSSQAWPGRLEESDPLAAVRERNRVIFGTEQLHNDYAQWLQQYPRGEQLNYVFQPNGGRRIYLAGSRPDPSMLDVARRARAHITLLQVLPANILPGQEQLLINLAMASGCKILVPQHHDPLFKGAKLTNLSKLRQLLKEQSDIVFQEMVPGRWYGFD